MSGSHSGLGFVELAAALKFLSGADLVLGWGIFTRTVCLAFWVAIFGVSGAYLLGLFRLPKDSPRDVIGVGPMIGGLTSIAVAILLATGMDGTKLGAFVDGWLPPVEEHLDDGLRDSRLVDSIVKKLHQSGVGTGLARDLNARLGYDKRFKEDFDAALAEARRLDVPLFVDFTGFT